MRGRKPDRPGLQEKKGNPRQRRRSRGPGKVSAETEASKLSAVAPASDGSPVADAGAPKIKPARLHPKFLEEPRLKEAFAIWMELEPDLKRLHLLQPLDRHTFAMYCVHMADWIIATRDIQKRGHWKNVKNVNGEPMPRLNPMVKVREIAERHILDIGARFGLDPSNRYRLLRDQAAAPKAADLFNQQPISDQPSAPVSDPHQLPSPLGLMDELATSPPGGRPN